MKKRTIVVLSETAKYGRIFITKNKLDPAECRIVTPDNINAIRGLSATKLYVDYGVSFDLSDWVVIQEAFAHSKRPPFKVIPVGDTIPGDAR